MCGGQYSPVWLLQPSAAKARKEKAKQARAAKKDAKPKKPVVKKAAKAQKPRTVGTRFSVRIANLKKAAGATNAAK